ncbi:MAG: aminopeptidase [Deltaproteobacteria bacterium]|nr:aminopeptidase [Deltaproteobacteria bacterium]
MLTEKQLDRYADILIWGLKTSRTNTIKRGNLFLVRFDLAALGLAEILQAKLLDMGMHVVLRMNSTPRMECDFYEKANGKQLVFSPPGERPFFNALNGSVYLHAPESITHLSHIDPKKLGKAAVARKFVRDILDKREEKGDFSWTLCTLPTEELARHADLSLDAYSRQVVKACFLNKTKPVASWKEIYKKAAGIKKWLNSLDIEHLHIESSHVDLIVTPGDRRRWIGISGHNIPSFEIFISPDWRGTSGTYYADQPSYRNGNLVEGARLSFAKGKAVKVEAGRGESFLRKQLALDAGACRIGEFSLTDRRFSKIDRFMANTLFDENYGGKDGNCHIALGSSYSDTYSGDKSRLTKKIKASLGFNDSALHWDLVNTEKKRVTARLKGGASKVIYENGVFGC